jgi:hypothetical protein
MVKLKYFFRIQVVRHNENYILPRTKVVQAVSIETKENNI